MPPEQLGDLIESFEVEAVALKTQIVEICYHMQGGCELNTAWGLSFSDREILIRVINKKLKEAHPGGKEYM